MMAKRKFLKSDMEYILSQLLETNFQKHGDQDMVIEYLLSQYVHLFGEISRSAQVEQLMGFKNLSKEI
jgi:hypothetical protein